MKYLFLRVLILLFGLALIDALGQVAPTPSPAEVPAATPAPDIVDLFRAVADADLARATSLLEEGADANAALPLPAPSDFVKHFEGTTLDYYVTYEPGLTPLMLAAAMGYPDIVRLLIEHGAKPFAKTKKHHTFALWLAGRNGHTEVMRILLGVGPGSDADRLRIQINLAEQKAFLWKDGILEKTMPISSGRKNFPTKNGHFIVTDKYREWKSTIYPARMPYYLRLSCRDFGLHGGVIPGYPASHGCVRLSLQDAKELFAIVPVGTLVEIE